MTDDVTKFLKIPKIIGSDPLINLPDQNGRALDQIDAILGNPPRMIAAIKPTQLTASTFATINLTAIVGAGITLEGGDSLKVPTSGMYLLSSYEYLDGEGQDAMARSWVGTTMIASTKATAMRYPAEGGLPMSGYVEIAAGEAVKLDTWRSTNGWVVGGRLSLAWIAPLVGSTPVRVHDYPQHDPITGKVLS